MIAIADDHRHRRRRGRPSAAPWRCPRAGMRVTVLDRRCRPAGAVVGQCRPYRGRAGRAARLARGDALACRRRLFARGGALDLPLGDGARTGCRSPPRYAGGRQPRRVSRPARAALGGAARGGDAGMARLVARSARPICCARTAISSSGTTRSDRARRARRGSAADTGIAHGRAMPTQPSAAPRSRLTRSVGGAIRFAGSGQIADLVRARRPRWKRRSSRRRRHDRPRPRATLGRRATARSRVRRPRRRPGAGRRRRRSRALVAPPATACR